MKHNGTVFEYEKEKNKDLMRAFHQCLHTHCGMPFIKMCEHISHAPASRFWVSEERATIVVSQMLEGKHPVLKPQKTEMYNEIYRRVQALRAVYPDRSISDLVFDVVHQPAPSFYYTPSSVREIIYRIKREWFEKRQQRQHP